jgi:ATP-binding protein involved in chromosome partitioning
MFFGKKNKDKIKDKNSVNNANNFNDGKNLNDFLQKIPEVKNVKKIILVASAKGGVGKSTISCNLALAMQKKGLNVALVDGDIYGPSIPHLMNLKDKPQTKDNLLLPIISGKIKCISIGSIIDEKQAGVWRGPMVTKILQQLIRSVNWGFDEKEVDIMIIDMPPGTGDVYLSIAEKFPISGVVAISTPQNLAIIDVVKSLDCFEKLKIKIIGLIENMSYLEINGKREFIFGQNGAKKFAEKEKINFLGEIPILQRISDANENRNLLDLHKEKSEISEIFEQISQKILKELS